MANDIVHVGGYCISDEDLCRASEDTLDMLEDMIGMARDWRENHAECSEEGCREIVTRGDDFFATPCGTYCDEHMVEHCRSCEICRKEFDMKAED